ncbi:MAG: HEPN domain-containing protein [Armatimonadota bacterium]|nr:HEPN domain-containing protein [Armatimonadota bacterium]
MPVRTLTRDELIEVVQEFMRRVGVTEAILYGSRARGDHIKSSDVDLMVISPRFADTPPHRRLAPLHSEWDPELPFLEVLAYTPEEFERAKRGLGIERAAARTGIHITLRGDGDGAIVEHQPPPEPGGERMRPETKNWLTEAGTNRRVARLLSEANVFSQAIYHARQAVEAALKAACVELRAEEPPRTHALHELAETAFGDVPGEVKGPLRELEAYYILTRYPTEVIPSPTTYYNELDAESALVAMESVLEWVGEQLPESGLPTAGDVPEDAGLDDEPGDEDTSDDDG